MQDIRREVKHLGLSEEDIAESPRRMRAYYPPPAPRKSIEIFRFLRKNDNHVTSVSGGMQTIVTGLDKSALRSIAPAYKLDFDRYVHLVDFYESKMLDQHDRAREQPN